ncbi:Uncharacterised protein [Mycobacteroides abscessus]|nr:Uncharacterised protein [Mycobacteroides abscessus]
MYGADARTSSPVTRSSGSSWAQTADATSTPAYPRKIPSATLCGQSSPVSPAAVHEASSSSMRASASVATSARSTGSTCSICERSSAPGGGWIASGSTGNSTVNGSLSPPSGSIVVRSCGPASSRS